MGTTVAIADWIKRVADDERKRDEARVTERETAARKARLIRRNGRHLIHELCVALTRDVAAFRAEFAGDRARDLDAAVAVCTYRFTVAAGMPPREDRIDVQFTGNDSGTLQMKHRGTGQVFAAADALSEFLFVPVLTGRPR